MAPFPWLLPVLSLVAFLYASVGHAGASGYVAVLALAGLAPVEIRPLALALNLVVAAQGCWQFQRAGHLPWPLFRPLVLAGLPAAFLGGWLALPDPWFRRLLALVLIGSAGRLLQERRDPPQLRIPSRPQLLVSGLGLGLLAGLSGTGGGVFLTPLLLLARWASSRQAAAVSSLFILGNSVCGLAGLVLAQRRALPPFPPGLPWMVLTVLVAGLVGTRLGTHHLPVAWLRRLLALVVLLAACKLLATA